jgi:hypothetical protein
MGKAQRRKSARVTRNAAKRIFSGDPGIATLKLGAALPRRHSRGAQMNAKSFALRHRMPAALSGLKSSDAHSLITAANALRGGSLGRKEGGGTAGVRPRVGPFALRHSPRVSQIKLSGRGDAAQRARMRRILHRRRCEGWQAISHRERLNPACGCLCSSTGRARRPGWRGSLPDVYDAPALSGAAARSRRPCAQTPTSRVAARTRRERLSPVRR